MTTKQRLEMAGWTPEKLRGRLAECRANRREFRGIPDSSRRTYRALNARFYLMHKAQLFTLTR